MFSFYEQFIENRKAINSFRTLTPWTKSSRAGYVIIDGNELMNCASNDYLGLSDDPRLIQAAVKTAENIGAGLPSSRLVAGHHELYDDVEQAIALWQGTENALLFPTGFQTNIALMQALLDEEVCGQKPLVFFDKLNHASLYQGVRLSGAELVRYRHLDVNHLEDLLQKYASSPRPKFIVSETVYSMDGDTCNVLSLEALAGQYNALLILDDAHSIGLYGDKGQGLAYQAKSAIIMGTFSKAMGLMGGFVACCTVLKEYLLQKAGGLIYSTAVSPFVLGAILKAILIVPSLTQQKNHVHSLADYVRQLAIQKGIKTTGNSHIVPIILKDNLATVDTANRLKQAGFWVVAIRPPTVPPNTARLRLTFHPAHTKQELDDLFSHL